MSRASELREAPSNRRQAEDSRVGKCVRELRLPRSVLAQKRPFEQVRFRADDVAELVCRVVRRIRIDAGDQHDDNLAPRGKLRKLGQKLLAKLDSYNNARSAQRNAEHTYNLTRRLYELFLDEDRQYTMAYYRDTDKSLEEAQLDKKAHIASKLFLQKGKSSGMRVLDIGCGWGGLALYLHRH